MYILKTAREKSVEQVGFAKPAQGSDCSVYLETSLFPRVFLWVINKKMYMAITRKTIQAVCPNTVFHYINVFSACVCVVV